MEHQQIDYRTHPREKDHVAPLNHVYVIDIGSCNCSTEKSIFRLTWDNVCVAADTYLCFSDSGKILGGANKSLYDSSINN